jgi:hypothetical protein
MNNFIKKIQDFKGEIGKVEFNNQENFEAIEQFLRENEELLKKVMKKNEKFQEEFVKELKEIAENSYSAFETLDLISEDIQLNKKIGETEKEKTFSENVSTSYNKLNSLINKLKKEEININILFPNIIEINHPLLDKKLSLIIENFECEYEYKERKKGKVIRKASVRIQNEIEIETLIEVLEDIIRLMKLAENNEEDSTILKEYVKILEEFLQKLLEEFYLKQ